MDPTDDGVADPKSSHETSQTKDDSGARGSLNSSDTSYPDDDESGQGSVPRIDSLDDATDETKNKLLASMFPSLKQDKIDAALKQAVGDFQGALDHLLTLQFLDFNDIEAVPVDHYFRPGDEGYYEASTKGQRRRKKRTKKQRAAERAEAAELEEACKWHLRHLDLKRVTNRPQAINDDIVFISERLDFPFDGVAQAYHKNGRSQAKAALAVLDSFIAEGVEAQGDAANARVKKLGRRYKKVPAEYLSAIVQIADIPQWAEDIAALLERHFEASKGPLSVSYSLAPIEDEVEDGFSVVAGRNAGGKENARNARAPYSGALNGASLATLRTQASLHEQARLSASASAASVLRKGRSNPLYRQGAVVYTEQARDSAQRAAAANRQAALHAISGRRTRDCIDLHGLTVSDGVEVAQEAVREWWEGLGEYRAREAKRGFTVITGQGRHCPGGVSRMRRGVPAALLNAGWAFTVETGKVVVTGRR